VPVKSAERQAALMDHKTREFLVRQQTQTVNAIRARLGEFGIVVPTGIHTVDRLLAAAEEGPEAARPAVDSPRRAAARHPRPHRQGEPETPSPQASAATG
jgi:transposase